MTTMDEDLPFPRVGYIYQGSSSMFHLLLNSYFTQPHQTFSSVPCQFALRIALPNHLTARSGNCCGSHSAALIAR